MPSKISATFNISNNPRAIVIEVYLLRRWLKNKLPFGNYPRLLLAWTSTEAVRTQSRELLLGRSLAEFHMVARFVSSTRCVENLYGAPSDGGVSLTQVGGQNSLFRHANIHCHLT